LAKSDKTISIKSWGNSHKLDVIDLQQINVKVFVTEESSVSYQNFIQVFNKWMEEADHDDYLNYADYSFTHAGPGVLLISKRVNYSIDNARNRHGFLYNQKEKVEGNNHQKISQAFIKTFKKCQKLEQEQDLGNKVRFKGGEILFMVNNRHLAPNTQETFEAVKLELSPVLEKVYGNVDFTLKRASADSRERFSVLISSTSNLDVSSLLVNLEK
tara:strand:- start:346 stop:987 length:642 start_codon:yes stop_codon:yes gene_type:complete